MADIRPIRPWRYNPSLVRELDSVTSPLFDVVSERQRQNLYQQPYNSIHLSVPQGPQPADRAAARLAEWKKSGVLIQDKLPAIYVYYQYFKLPGSAQELCRKGFVCHVRVHDWKDNVILRHENTIPKAVNDRLQLLEKTNLHVSPTHGLYTDTRFELEPYMDEAIRFPLYETEDYQGVRDVLAVIQDVQVISRFMEVMRPKPVILADGHHRYESSLHVMHKRQAANPKDTGQEAYHFHLMYLTNTEAGDLRILPTHRLIKGLNPPDEKSILRSLQEDFIIKPVDDPYSLPEVISGKKWAFGLLFHDSAYKIRLKEEAFETLPWKFPEEVKRLDLTVMHYFIIEKVFGIAGKDQRQSEHIDFDRSFPDCLARVLRQDAQLAIITQDVSIEDVKSVCHSGSTMPQKSTYFYPKVICGFLFTSILEDEFRNPDYSPF